MTRGWLLFYFFLFCWAMLTSYVSIVLHRGLAHRALHVPQPFVHAVTAICNVFVIWVNPKTWVAEHRLHHAHSDTEEDPDKKPGWGLLKFVWWSLANPAGPHDPHVEKITRDKELNTPVMRFFSDLRVGLVCQLGTGQIIPWLIMRDLWGTLAVWFGIRLGGITVKAIQGWFAHNRAYGYRNFETDDHSVNMNGWFSTFLSAGESLQNNHHARPTSPCHAFKPGERDFGWGMVRLYAKLGIVTFPRRSTVTPIPEIVAA